MSNLSTLIKLQNIGDEPLLEVEFIETGVLEANIRINNDKNQPILTVHPSGTSPRDSNRREGPVPHFHIKKGNKRFPIAIRLCEAEYFKHGDCNKTLSETKLGSSFRDDIQATLKARCKIFDGTNWEYLVSEWNKFAESSSYFKKVPEGTKQPNYRKLR